MCPHQLGLGARRGSAGRLISSTTTSSPTTDFTPKAIARYEEWLRRVVVHRLEEALLHEEFDLVRELAAPIPIRVLGHILGLPEAELPHLVLLGDRLIADTEPEVVGDLAFHGERAEDRYKPFGSPWADELCALGRTHYADRRECPRADLVAVDRRGAPRVLARR